MSVQMTLQERLGEVRRRVLQLLWLDGLSRFVTVCLSSAVLIGLCDWWLRSDAPAWRISSTGLVALAAVSAAWYCLLAPFRARISNVELASQVEQRFPQLGDRLSNTIAFADATFHPGIGSPGLQQRLASQTEADSADLDFIDVVETRHVCRDVVFAVLIALSVSLLIGMHTTEAATAVGRLVHPLQQRSWPQSTELVLLDARFEPLTLEGTSWRKSAGSTLEFLVANTRGGLPGDARLLLKSGDEPVTQQPLAAEVFTNADGSVREVARVKLQLRSGPIYFRAVGGDDRGMPWHRVHVIPPPTVTEFTLTLHPPECLGQPPAKQPAGEFAVRAVVGSRVDISGRASRKLRSLKLHVDGKAAADATLAADGRQFQASFTIDKPGPGAYSFELIDRDGVSNHNDVRYEIDAIAERPPQVRLIAPTADVGVVPQASLPIRAEITDDFGIQSVVLNYRLLASSSAQDDPSREPAWTALSLYHSDSADQKQLTIDHTWEISQLDLQPGTRIAYFVTAADACTPGNDELGKSVERSLRIVTEEEKAAELASRETLLRQSVEAALQTHQEAIGRTESVSRRLESQGRLERPDEDALRRVQQDGSHVQARVVAPVDGIGGQAARLLAELTTNHLEDTAAEHRYRQVVAASSLLADVAFPALELHLAEVRRLVERFDHNSTEPNSQSAALRESLRATAARQKSIAASLQAMLDLLARWEREHHLAGGLGELIREQETLNNDTAQIGRRTLTHARENLSKEDRDALADLAERQRNQAELAEQWQQRLEQAADSPQAGAAVAQLKTQPVSGPMRQAAAHLQENEISLAAQLQQEALDRLSGLNDQLQGRLRTAAPASPAALHTEALALARMRQELADLRVATQQAIQAGEAPKAREQFDDLARRQASLRETTESSAERLRGRQAMTAASAVARAAVEMQAAELQLNEASASRAVPRQAAAEQQLARAARELERWLDASQHAQRQAASEVVEALAKAIERQAAVNSQTQILADEWAAAGSWNRTRLKSLADLRDAQASLRTDTEQFADRAEIGRAGRFAIEDAAQRMQAAWAGLQQRDVGKTTRGRQQQALAMLQSLHNALQSAGDRLQAAAQHAQQDASSGQGADQPNWNELRVIRAIQQQLQSRTAELEQQSSTAGEQPLAAETDDALRRLAQRQRELHQLTQESGGSLLKPELSVTIDDPQVPASPDDEAAVLKQAQSAARAAVGAMESAAQHLASAETGAQTQEFQQQAIGSLDQLLALADRRGALSRQAALEPTGRQPDPRAEPRASDAPPPSVAQAPATPPNSQAGTEAGNATSADADQGSAELIRRQALVEGEWGHLPPAVREQVLNISGERTLPAYEELVRRYFEALADPAQPQPRN